MNNAKALDLTFVRMANEKYEIAVRNRKAREYSASVRSRKNAVKETIGDFCGAVSLVAMLVALYFIGAFFM